MSDQDTHPAAHRRVGFFGAIALFFKNYFNFKGRSSRGAFWWCVLFGLCASIFSFFLDLTPTGQNLTRLFVEHTGAQLIIFYPASGVFSLLLHLATFIPMLALSVRRAHDIGWSGWWVFLLLPMFFFNWVIAFSATHIQLGEFWWGIAEISSVLSLIGFATQIVVGLVTGHYQTNKYGPDIEAGREMEFRGDA